ncbi:hypothetical protein CHU98_g967 [Xylaria longipes]|nr:hypothetical protein CHU98_g967 [Xylaria longipes]
MCDEENIYVLQSAITLPTASNLSKYGYDFIVSTTQAAINSGLWEYMIESAEKQPITYLCYVVNPDDPHGNNLLVPIEKLLADTGNVNPFDIPAGTPFTNPQMLALTQLKFLQGIKLKIGLPPGKFPKDLPTVDMQEGIDSVNFDMYFSEACIVNLDPP